MTGAEFGARITAARALRGDFEHETREYTLQGSREPHWAAWAPRLSTALGALLDELGAPADGAAAPGNPLDVPGRLEDHTGVLGLALAPPHVARRRRGSAGRHGRCAGRRRRDAGRAVQAARAPVRREQ